MTRGNCGLFAVPRTVLVQRGVVSTLRRSVLELVAKPNHAKASLLYKVLVSLRTFFMKVLRVILA